MRRIASYLAIGIPLVLIVTCAVSETYKSWNRARQKRTMGDMFVLAATLEAYAEDHKTYAIGSAGATSTASEFDSLTPISFDALDRALKPKYARILPPRIDAWGNEFEVHVGASHYAIRSAGSDGRFDQTTYALKAVKTDSAAQDIVLCDGNFIQMPKGFTAAE
jgi:hypothetical protein